MKTTGIKNEAQRVAHNKQAIKNVVIASGSTTNERNTTKSITFEIMKGYRVQTGT